MFLKGRLVYVNPAGVKLLGAAKSAEVLNRSMDELVHPDDRVALQEAVHRSLGAAPLAKVKVRLLRLDGSVAHVEWVSLPVLYKRQPAVQVHCHSLRERKRISEALQKSNLLNRRLVEHLPHRVFIKDRQSVYLACNARFAADMGVRPEVIVGNDDYALCPAALAESYRADDRETMESGQIKDIEERYFVEGRERWAHTVKVPFRDDHGGIIGVMGILEDITERKQAEAASRASHEQLQHIIAALPLGMHFYELMEDGRLVFTGANPAADRILGFGHASHVGQTIDQVFPGLATTDIPAHYKAVARDGVVWQVDQVFYDANGIKGAYEVVAFQTEPGKMTAVFSDVTERKRTEETVRRDEARFRSLANLLQFRGETIQKFLDFALNEALSLTGSKFGYIYFYHEDRQQFVLSTWSKDVMKECAVANPQACYELDKTGIWGEAVRQRRPILLNDFQAAHPLKKGYPPGHVALSRFLTVPIFSGDSIVAVVGVANKETDYDEADIQQLHLLMEALWKVVEQRRALESLRESEARLKEAQRIARLGNWVLDLVANTFTWSDEADAIFEIGQGASVITYEAFLEAIHPEDREAVNAAYSQSVNRHEPWEITHRLLMREGRVKHVLERCETQYGPDGKPLRFIGTVQDVTERKEAEEARIRLENQYRQAVKMEAVGRLAGGVAHDFNNKLQIILGSVDMMMRDLPEGHECRADLAEIERAAKRSADLTRQLLAFSRRQTIAPQMIDVNQVLSGSLKMLGRLLGENIHLQFLQKPDTGSIYMDPGQLDQIMANLAVNARDAITGVGHIIVEASNCTLREADCRGKADFVMPDDYVLITFRDDGAGIPPDIQSQIFEPFFTTKAVGKGTGLGLATVYGIVKQNKGAITVQSEPGKGTTFCIWLPRVREPAMLTDQVTEARPVGTETVLLVEDEESVLQLTERELREQGYTVMAASTADQALQLCMNYQGDIHLLLTDVIMPGMSGKAVAERIQELRPGIRVLFMSGYPSDVLEQHGQLASQTDILHKPFSSLSLAQRVREALDAER